MPRDGGRDVSYVIAGYAVTFSSLAAYAGWVLRRRRSLARQLAPGPR